MYKSAKVLVCVNNSDLGEVRKVDLSDIKLVNLLRNVKNPVNIWWIGKKLVPLHQK